MTERPEDQPVSAADQVLGWSLPAGQNVEKSTGRRTFLRFSALVAGVLLALGSIAVALLGVVRTRSMDLPWGEHVRLGLFGMGGPVAWTCGEGHQHYSLPYWLGGAVGLVPSAALLWLGRRRRSAGRAPG